MSARSIIAEVVGHGNATDVLEDLREAGYHLVRVERTEGPWTPFEDRPDDVHGRRLDLLVEIDDDVVLRNHYAVTTRALRTSVVDVVREAWDGLAGQTGVDLMRLFRREGSA